MVRVTSQFDRTFQLIRGMAPELAQAATLKTIGQLVRHYVDTNGYPMPDSEEGRLLDRLDDLLLALDEAGAWPDEHVGTIE